MSNDALKRLGAVVRGWRLYQRVNLTEQELAKAINPIVAGWMRYYGHFYRSKL
ncbi:group II intron maturase-specific domain-containing protein [Nonomuraea sp. NPDC003201]